MRKFLPALVLTGALTASAPANATILGDLIQGCLAGGGILAGTTYFALTPALVVNWVTLPGYSLILNNAVIGCAFGSAVSVLTN